MLMGCMSDSVLSYILLTEGTMKNSTDNSREACDLQGRSKMKALWDRQVDKIKNGCFTCPLCKEQFSGLSALGAHLKEHCT